MSLPMSVHIHQTRFGLIVSFGFPEGQFLGLDGDDGALIEEITADKTHSLIAQSGSDQTLAKAHRAA